MVRQFGRIALALVVALAAACSPIVRNHGYMPTAEDLSLITVGVDTRETVEASIGAPTSGGVATEGGYYYIRSRWETRAFFAPKEVDRQLLAISFTPGGVVSNVELFTLEDGQVVVLSRRVTGTSIQNVSFIRQLLGNIGRPGLATPQ